jgi:hypothetical protein
MAKLEREALLTQQRGLVLQGVALMLSTLTAVAALVISVVAIGSSNDDRRDAARTHCLEQFESFVSAYGRVVLPMTQKLAAAETAEEKAAVPALTTSDFGVLALQGGFAGRECADHGLVSKKKLASVGDFEKAGEGTAVDQADYLATLVSAVTPDL